MSGSQYRIDEIKYNIDTAIQKSMLETEEDKWKIILEVQSRLYEEFGIDEWNSSSMVDLEVLYVSKLWRIFRRK